VAFLRGRSGAGEGRGEEGEGKKEGRERRNWGGSGRTCIGNNQGGKGGKEANINEGAERR